jgi:hypothetical protein
MTVHLRLTQELAQDVRRDLTRPHPVAFERMGFLKATAGRLRDGGIVLIAFEYVPVADDAYIPDEQVGARITDAGFRPARQATLAAPVSIVHIHMHEHLGMPGFSRTDARESAIFMEDFIKIRPSMPHAAVILSRDAAAGRCWRKGLPVSPIHAISLVGAPITKVQNA